MREKKLFLWSFHFKMYSSSEPIFPTDLLLTLLQRKNAEMNLFNLLHFFAINNFFFENYIEVILRAMSAHEWRRWFERKMLHLPKKRTFSSAKTEIEREKKIGINVESSTIEARARRREWKLLASTQDILASHHITQHTHTTSRPHERVPHPLRTRSREEVGKIHLIAFCWLVVGFAFVVTYVFSFFSCRLQSYETVLSPL